MDAAFSGQEASPAALVETLLLGVGQDILDGDFDTFSGIFHLPQAVDTLSGSACIETRDDLRAVFERVRAYHRDRGVTRITRRCVAAARRDADTIAATVECTLVARTRRLLGPFSLLTLLRRFDGNWKIVSVQYIIPRAPDLNRAISAPPDQPSP